MRKKSNKRPIPITIIGSLAILAGIYIIVASIPLLQLTGEIMSSEDPGIFLFMPIIPIIASVILVAVGIGLLKMKKWLPRSLLALLILYATLLILSFIDNPKAFWMVWIDLIISVAIVWYVFTKKKLFVN